MEWFFFCYVIEIPLSCCLPGEIFVWRIITDTFLTVLFTPDTPDTSDTSDTSDGAGEKTFLPVERWSFVPVGSRSYLARPLADGTAAGKSMGLPAPYPGQVKDLHRAEIAYRNFPYAVGPPKSRRTSEGSLPYPSHGSM